MAEINTTLFFRNNRDYSVGSIKLDLIINESYNFGSEISQYNIEDGSEISDHIRKLLFQGSLTARVSNFSLYQNGLTSNKAQETYNKLKDIWNNEDLVDIVMIYDVFNKVGITNISTPRSAGMGESIEFDISFQEVNVVSLQEITIIANVKLADMNSNNNRQASPKLQTGKQQGVIR